MKQLATDVNVAEGEAKKDLRQQLDERKQRWENLKVRAGTAENRYNTLISQVMEEKKLRVEAEQRSGELLDMLVTAQRLRDEAEAKVKAVVGTRVASVQTESVGRLEIQMEELATHTEYQGVDAFEREIKSLKDQAGHYQGSYEDYKAFYDDANAELKSTTGQLASKNAALVVMKPISGYAGGRPDPDPALWAGSPCS